MHRSSSSTTPSVRTSSMADGSFKVSSLRLPTSMLPLNHCLTTAHNCNPSGETCYPLTIHMLDMLSTFPVPPPFKGGADPLDVDIVHKELTIVASFIVECLKTLSFLIEWLFYQSSRDKPPVFRLQELCKRWNIIFPWCSYVVNQIRHKDSIKEYSGLYTWIAKILAMSGIMATDYPGIDSLVIFGTPGYITLLLRMFFESVILTEDQYLRETIAHAFFFAFRVSQDEYASQIARAIEEHDSRQQGSSGSAMSLCLRHLRRQSRPKDIRMCQLRLLTFSLDKVQSACAHRPAYLISRRTIRAITLVLYRIAIGSTDSSDKHNLVHQYTSCKGACVLRTLEELFHFLWWCARNGGSVAIVMILKGNILQTMVRLHLALGIGSSSESEGCTTTSRFFKLLLEALTIYLTSEAVLRQLSKSLELRSLKKLEKQLEESSDDLWKDWYNFRAEAHTRITIWYMYQMTRRSQACHSERTEVVLPQDVKRCSGCKKAFYCSKRCQKDDWTEHRSRCIDLSKSRKNGVLNFHSNTLEIDFYNYLAIKEFERVRTQYYEVLHYRGKKDDLADRPVVVVDYRQPQCETSLINFGKFMDSPFAKELNEDGREKLRTKDFHSVVVIVFESINMLCMPILLSQTPQGRS